MKSRRQQWLERTRKLPAAPGVYLMKDDRGEVIYVGKAKNLRARVRQYFQAGTSDYRAFIGLLSGMLFDLETLVARSEKEALLLEREMIRRHEPRFNVIWRDDKQFLCLRVDTRQPFPWVEVVRRMTDDGARYFGPFHSASSARQTLRVVNRHFTLRTCTDSVFKSRKRPCLEFQIGRCPAPCVFEVDPQAYQENVSDVLMFLEGKGRELARRLERRMWDASERTDYEVAAHYRDQLRAVERTLSRQKVAFSTLKDQDVFGLYREGEDAAVSVVEVRGGRVENIDVQLFEGLAEEDAGVLVSVILSRYSLVDDAAGLSPPREVVVPTDLADAGHLSELLSDKRGRKVTVLRPQRGDRVALVDLAEENAEHGFHEQRRKSGAIERMLDTLRQRLRLVRFPGRVECFDISNLGEEEIVASRVVFVAGQPEKKLYRHYRLRNPDGQNDFAAMYEVVLRRLQRGQKERDLPDLIVVDGGKGQLGAARAAAKDAGVDGIDLASLAKSRTVGRTGDDRATRSPERVFRPGAKDPIVLPQTSAELLFLARVRDEAHRFALAYQKKKRRQARARSPLDDIPGIGPTRRRALLAHLGSLARIRGATREDLARVPGIGPKQARVIWAALHPGDAAASTNIK